MITKENFLRYYEIQIGGEYNMIMDAHKVMQITGLSKEQYIDIITNYGKYYTKYVNHND